MSQTKAQLIQPIGIVTASTIQVSGVVTATTLVGDVTGTVSGLSTTTANLDVGIVTTSGMVGDVTGSASSIFSGNNIVAGVVTATKFTGNTSGKSSGLADGTNTNVGIFTATSFIGNLTGNAASLSNTDSQLNLGIVTATSFVGDFTGIGSGLTGTPNVVAGVVTSTFVGNFTGIGSGLSGTPNVRAGVVTASSFVGDFTGIGSGLTGTPNVTAGVVTASSFLGNFTGHASGLTGTPNVTAGLITASSLLGNFTGFASGITGTPNITAGVVTASAFAGNFTGIGSGLTGTPNYTAGIVTASSFIGNFTGIGSGLTGTPSFTAGIVTASNFLGNFTGVASGISGTPNITVAIMTATTYNGDGSNLTGVASTNWITNNVTANSSNTTINLNHGNQIILTQTANTTIAFSNVSTTESISIIRSQGTGSITWPAAVKWDRGNAPAMTVPNVTYQEVQQFDLITRDGGTTWYGWESINTTPTKIGFFSWGSNNDGQLGLNSRSRISSPVQIPGDWVYAAVGSENTGKHMLARKRDGTLWGWGANENGELGQSTTTKYSSPVQIPASEDAEWAQVSTGGRYSVATKSDGTMWSWGYNGPTGYLGHGQSGSSHNCSSPEQISGTLWNYDMGQEVRTLSAASGGNFAITRQNKLYSWGYNNQGQLGLNNKTQYNSPQQVGSDTNWHKLAKTGPSRTMGALKEDGTLWMWGEGGQGQLAQNNTTNYSSPRQIPGVDWRSCATANNATWATKNDGTLWAFGYNNHGQLGQNEAGNDKGRSSPTQIPGTDWDIANCWYTTIGCSKKDGSLWTAGNSWSNDSRALGVTYVKVSSPVQMPGSWKTVTFASGSYGGLKSVT